MSGTEDPRVTPGEESTALEQIEEVSVLDDLGEPEEPGTGAPATLSSAEFATWKICYHILRSGRPSVTAAKIRIPFAALPGPSGACAARDFSGAIALVVRHQTVVLSIHERRRDHKIG